MKINQVNLTYQPEEDRLLLKVNTLERAEFGYWLTRAVVAKLLKSMSELERVAYGETDAARFVGMHKQAVTEVQRELHAAHSDYQTPYDTSTQSYPIGTTPLLLSQLSLRVDGKLTLLTLTSSSGISTSVSLDANLLASINKLLVDIVGRIDWALLEPVNTQPPTAEAGQLH